MATRSARIQNLDANSLFIATQPLINGRFHWSLIAVDSLGVMRQYQWHEYSGGKTAETYSAQKIERLSPRSASGINTLAYFKIAGYIHADHQRLDAYCRSVFPRSYPTVQQNRDHGITARAWLVRVLDCIQKGGFIVRSDAIKGIEGTVVKLSQEKEKQYLEYFLKQIPYLAPVLVI
ncbi:hypothetical protein HGRIS_009186 [Hohenbuehelia grisea]|uniref:Uncharacterized protein n=1 Tax=Hohenbuehelia grisea TaxID=104357 RepID=A0ABR3J0C4_9AGAR